MGLGMRASVFPTSFPVLGGSEPGDQGISNLGYRGHTIQRWISAAPGWDVH